VPVIFFVAAEFAHVTESRLSIVLDDFKDLRFGWSLTGEYLFVPNIETLRYAAIFSHPISSLKHYPKPKEYGCLYPVKIRILMISLTLNLTRITVPRQQLPHLNTLHQLSYWTPSQSLTIHGEKELKYLSAPAV